MTIFGDSAKFGASVDHALKTSKNESHMCVDCRDFTVMSPESRFSQFFIQS